MLIKNLISNLSKYNPDANIVLVDSEEIQLSFVGENDTPETTKLVFIEGCDICEPCYYYNEEYCSFYDKYCMNDEFCEVFDKLKHGFVDDKNGNDS